MSDSPRETEARLQAQWLRCKESFPSFPIALVIVYQKLPDERRARFLTGLIESYLAQCDPSRLGYPPDPNIRMIWSQRLTRSSLTKLIDR